MRKRIQELQERESEMDVYLSLIVYLLVIKREKSRTKQTTD